jgi:hypothetical protein
MQGASCLIVSHFKYCSRNDVCCTLGKAPSKLLSIWGQGPGLTAGLQGPGRPPNPSENVVAVQQPFCISVPGLVATSPETPP